VGQNLIFLVIFNLHREERNLFCKRTFIAFRGFNRKDCVENPLTLYVFLLSKNQHSTCRSISSLLLNKEGLSHFGFRWCYFKTYCI